MRTIIFVLIGLTSWIVSLVQDESYIAVIATMALSLINSLLIAQLFYKGGETNIPSIFVTSTYWFAISVVPVLHTYWQAQLVILIVLSVLLTLLQIGYQQEATEEVFLATLICCFLAPLKPVLITSIFLLWGYLIAKGHMTWRVWAASLIAIALRVMIMIILHYFGWMEWLWLENIPRLSGVQWAIFGGVFLCTSLAILLPLRKASIASGVINIITTLGLLIFGILIYLQLILISI